MKVMICLLCGFSPGDIWELRRPSNCDISFLLATSCLTTLYCYWWHHGVQFLSLRCLLAVPLAILAFVYSFALHKARKL